MHYGFSRIVKHSFENTIVKITEELQKEGFGVLTKIDVRETLKNKLDVDFHKYVILGACNPAYAYGALQAEEDIGLLLPCNVVVREQDGKTVVSAFDPMSMMALTKNQELQDIAKQVKERLERVMSNV